MPHVTFVVPDLGYSAPAKQLSLIAPALVSPCWTVEIVALGDGPFIHLLRTAGIAVSTSRSRSVSNWGRLRFVLPKPGHGIVHAFGLHVLRRLWAATIGHRRPPIVLTLTGRERFGRLDRRCLRIVSRVLVHHRHAADALIEQGIPSDRVTVVVPVVSSSSGFQPEPIGTRVGNLSYETGVHRIVTAGRMDDRHRLFNAVWAFEFIRYPHEGAHLIVVGDGPGRAGMESSALGMAPEGSHVHFLGARPDVPAMLQTADVVMVPQLRGGVNVALEAMAAGKAIVAANTPELASIIRHGDTGLLVDPRDAAAAASAVRKLLLDPAKRQQLGDAARKYVDDHHQVATAVRALETVYSDEFTSTRTSLWAE